jgi:hypothetical protein
MSEIFPLLNNFYSCGFNLVSLLIGKYIDDIAYPYTTGCFNNTLLDLGSSELIAFLIAISE